MITKETLKETGQTIVTICNYDRYNQNSETRKQARKHPGNTRETPGKHPGNSRETARKHPGNSEETNKKKGNKGNKENKGNNNPLPLEFDFVSDEFRDSFSLWLDYKYERKERYKSERSVKMCYDKLVKLSDSNPSIAAEVVNQSIANNWAGLFALKNENNGNKNTANEADSGDIIIRTTVL